MPTYEYQCLKCGAKEEITHRISDPPIQSLSPDNCPNVEGGVCPGKAERLISLSSFQLKGSGWFASGGY